MTTRALTIGPRAPNHYVVRPQNVQLCEQPVCPGLAGEKYKFHTGQSLDAAEQ